MRKETYNFIFRRRMVKYFSDPHERVHYGLFFNACHLKGPLANLVYKAILYDLIMHLSCIFVLVFFIIHFLGMETHTACRILMFSSINFGVLWHYMERFHLLWLKDKLFLLPPLKFQKKKFLLVEHQYCSLLSYNNNVIR